MRFSSRFPLIFALAGLPLLPACAKPGDGADPKESDTSTESGAPSASDTATEDGDDECYNLSSDSLYGFTFRGCELPRPCPTVEYTSGFDTCEVDPVYEPTAAACIIEGLRNDTPGEYGIRDCPGGQYSRSIVLHVLGDGTVLYQFAGHYDIGGPQRETWRSIPADAQLDACSTDSDADFSHCIEAILEEECQTGEPSCP